MPAGQAGMHPGIRPLLANMIVLIYFFSGIACAY